MDAFFLPKIFQILLYLKAKRKALSTKNVLTSINLERSANKKRKKKKNQNNKNQNKSINKTKSKKINNDNDISNNKVMEKKKNKNIHNLELFQIP